MIDNKKLSGLLGLANRARKLAFGEVAHKAIANPKTRLLLISDEASERTTEKLINRAKYYEKEYFIVDDHTLNSSTGNSNKKYLVVLDGGFSKLIIDICRKRWRYG